LSFRRAQHGNVCYNTSAMIATAKRIKFTVDEYFRMSDAGVFDDRKVELVHGRILQIHAQASPQRAAITLGMIILNRHFSDSHKFWLLVQSTLILQPYGAPEPDFHIFDVPVGTPDSKLPRPFFVMEVSDKTYRRDSGSKLRQYAAAGIQDYWIENLNENRIEVYRDPVNPTGKWDDWQYHDKKHYKRGQKIKLFHLPKIALDVSDLLPG
jgi:Uma2 family endonuclease